MFLDLYVYFGSGLLIGLAYLTMISVLAQYAWEYKLIINIAYYIFMIFYLRSMFQHQSHIGYIHTIHSAKFVPRGYGKVRTAFRYITNLGVIRASLLFIVATLITCYPVFYSYCDYGGFGLSKKGLYFSTLIVLGHSSLKVTRFVPEFFRLSNLELNYQRHAENRDVLDIDYVAEKEAYKKYLRAHGCSEIGVLNEKEFLGGLHGSKYSMTNDQRFGLMFIFV